MAGARAALERHGAVVAPPALARRDARRERGTRVLVGKQAREDPFCADLAASPLPSAGLPGPAILGFPACAVVVRRDAFVAVGGYERRFMVGGEESLLAYDLASAGWSIVYAAELTVHHHPSPARNPAARRRIQSRNALWVAWLRRPWPSALRVTLRRESLPGLLAALPGLPWALRNRRVIPPHVEALRRLLEREPPAPDRRMRYQS
jgi:GT2 family glycosyltransferase